MNTTHLNRLWAAGTNPLKLLDNLEVESVAIVYEEVWGEAVQRGLMSYVKGVSI